MATETIRHTARVFGDTEAVSTDTAAHSVLLALDGSSQSDAAIALAGWLARARHTRVHVISVVEPACAVAIDELKMDNSAEWCAARRHVILDQIDGEDPYEAPWPVTVVPGSPVTLIADAANASPFDLLVLGLPRRADRMTLRADNALRIARRVTKPIVAVGHSLRVPPTACVAAIDFTRSSLQAARAASTLLAPGGTLFLVHVQPQLQSDEGLQLIYSQGIVGAFERLSNELGAPADIQVKHVLLEGNPRAELPAFCDQVNADLMAVGTSRVDVAHLHRARLSCSFLRAGTRSVLIAPAVPKSVGAPYWDD
jgi:nucleotide-binding universal stress UspA family protein